MKRKPTQVPDSLKTVDVKALLRKRGVYFKQRVNQEMKAAALPIAKELVSKRNKPVVKAEPQKFLNFSNDEALEYWGKQIHMVEVVEAKFENKVQQFIQKIGDAYIKNLQQETKGFFEDNVDELVVQAGIDFTPLLENIAVLAGNEANKLIGVKDPYLLFKYREQIAKNVEFFAKSMLSTDKDHLTNLLTNGLESGKSIPEISNMIQADFSEYSKMQATRITRTEVLRASNEAAIDAYKQSGVVEGKQWLTAGAVDECADYEGDVVGLDDNFPDGDPPLHPNCRCVLLPVLVGEKGLVIDNSKALREQIEQLESKIDKRTKAFKKLKAEKIDDEVYIKALEKHLGVEDES